MANKTLIVFIVFDLVFLLCAGLHLFIPVYTRMNIKNNTNVDNIASNLLPDHCPLTASMVNSVIMFIAFLLSVPAFFKRRDRTFLKLHAWIVVIAACLTLAIGIDIWFSTLETKKNLAPIWNKQTPQIQTMLQEKFQCCGYSNPALFVKDQTCITAATAARLGPCITPFGVFANQFLDVVFTTFFGFVAVDMFLLLAALCLIKDRKEKERYRLIDEKIGYGGI